MHNRLIYFSTLYSIILQSVHCVKIFTITISYRAGYHFTIHHHIFNITLTNLNFLEIIFVFLCLFFVQVVYLPVISRNQTMMKRKRDFIHLMLSLLTRECEHNLAENVTLLAHLRHLITIYMSTEVQLSKMEVLKNQITHHLVTPTFSILQWYCSTLF